MCQTGLTHSGSLMRTKRRQRHLAKAKRPEPPKGYPDPFSRLNPELVEDEINLADACPCCIDHQAEIEQSREARILLAWAGK